MQNSVRTKEKTHKFMYLLGLMLLVCVVMFMFFSPKKYLVSGQHDASHTEQPINQLNKYSLALELP